MANGQHTAKPNDAPSPTNADGDSGAEFSTAEVQEVEERLRLRAPVVFEIILQEGQAELQRPVNSLWWSGLAAGLCISFSLLGEALLSHFLPKTGWQDVVSSLGYSLGFLIVVIGRQQLFTENTITAVLPIFDDWTMAGAACLARLWSVVFLANLVGACLFALMLSSTGFIDADFLKAAIKVSEHALAPSWDTILVRGIGAGFLVAAMVWMLPSAEGSEALIVILLTYLIALADFSHVIAGSTETFLLVFEGIVPLLDGVFGFILPALIGNIIGGTALFAMISYAQVKEERSVPQ